MDIIGFVIIVWFLCLKFSAPACVLDLSHAFLSVNSALLVDSLRSAAECSEYILLPKPMAAFPVESLLVRRLSGVCFLCHAGSGRCKL